MYVYCVQVHMLALLTSVLAHIIRRGKVKWVPLWHISEKLLDAFRHYLLQLTDLKVQTQETLMRLTICMHLHTNGETVNKALENFLANSSHLVLSSLCMLHGQSCGLHLPAKAAGGVHAVLVNQDYWAKQRLDMTVSNPLWKVTCCSFLAGLH